MTGRVVIVTGSSGGLGFEVARYLCEGGNDVVMACRNEEKANRAIEKIKRLHPSALATYMHLDLASMESVRKFVDDFHETGKKLHVLVNNAGMLCNFKDTKKQYTPENFEVTMGTNHLGIEDAQEFSCDMEEYPITLEVRKHQQDARAEANRVSTKSRQLEEKDAIKSLSGSGKTSKPSATTTRSEEMAKASQDDSEGPYLLTNLLLDDLKKTGGDGGDSRIVNVTSNVHDPDTIKRRNKAVRDLQAMDMDNILLLKDNTYTGIQAYKNSKLANIMFSYELGRRLEGTGVTTNCVCPGFVPSTELIRNLSGANKFLYRYVLHGMLRFIKMTRTIGQGGQAICSLVSDEKYKGVSGKYFKDGAEQKSSEESLNEENQKKLWEMSGGYTHLEGYEPIDVPPPPVEEEPKEEPKEEAAAEASKEGEEKKEEAAENKTDEEKKEGDEKEPEDKEEKTEEKEEKMAEKEPEDKEVKPEVKIEDAKVEA